MKNARIKRKALTTVGLLICTLPVIAAVLCYFPLWKSRGGGAVVSGMALILLIPALLPLLRFIREKLRSPSARTLWLVCFILFLGLSAIAEEMVVISFVGFVSNLVGSIFFAIAKRYECEK